MPDWCRQTLLTVSVALLGWLLLQQMNTATRLTRLETEMAHTEKRLDQTTAKVVEILENK